ncbi:MAG: hypothetical protein K8S27_02345 [Candidatus Omnitrophica bacterium]|nr:hypothetical protein [Candidatus Omnitrophota bacterium]
MSFDFVCANEQTKEDSVSDDTIEKMRVNYSMNPFKPQLPKKTVPPVNTSVRQPPRQLPVNPSKKTPSNRTPSAVPQTTSNQTDPQNIDIPIVDPVVTLPPLDISGLIWDTDRPQAIINNKILEIGDIVDEFKIIHIYKQGVTGHYQGKDFTITP